MHEQLFKFQNFFDFFFAERNEVIGREKIKREEAMKSK